MMPPIVILAGGKATRLYPVTKTIPKAMLKIDGRPFIEYQMKLLKNKGIEKVVICAGFLGEQIQDFVKDGHEFGLDIKFSFDGEKLLGTGGSIKKALPLLGDIFFIMYGDSFLNTDFNQIYKYFNKQNKKALMTVYKNNNNWDKSNIEFKDGKIINYDKKILTNSMEYIDYGLSIAKKEIFDVINENEVSDLADIYKKIVFENQMAGYEIKERFYEIGSLKGIEETSAYITNLKMEKINGNNGLY